MLHGVVIRGSRRGATGPDFIFDTLTDSGSSLHERYRLGDDGMHLELHASLKRAGADQATEFVRVFDRTNPPAAKNNAPAVLPTR